MSDSGGLGEGAQFYNFTLNRGAPNRCPDASERVFRGEKEIGVREQSKQRLSRWGSLLCAVALVAGMGLPSVGAASAFAGDETVQAPLEVQDIPFESEEVNSDAPASDVAVPAPVGSDGEASTIDGEPSRGSTDAGGVPSPEASSPEQPVDEEPALSAGVEEGAVPNASVKADAPASEEASSAQSETAQDAAEETRTVFIAGWWPVDAPDMIEGSGAPSRYKVRKGSSVAGNPELVAEIQGDVAQAQQIHPDRKFIGWTTIPVDWATDGRLDLMAETLTVNSPRYDFNTPITADVALVSLWLVKEESATDDAIHVGGSSGITASGNLSGENVPDGSYVKVDAEAVESGAAYDKLMVVLGDGKCVLDGVYEVDMTVNGSEVHDGFGTLKLTFPVKAKAFGGRDGDWVVLWHVHNDGRITSQRVQVVDGHVTVEVSDLSTFAIGIPKQEASQEPGPSEDEAATGPEADGKTEKPVKDGERVAKKTASSTTPLAQTGDVTGGAVLFAMAAVSLLALVIARWQRS